jgi:hypothetical protein
LLSALLGEAGFMNSGDMHELGKVRRGGRRLTFGVAFLAILALGLTASAAAAAPGEQAHRSGPALGHSGSASVKVASRAAQARPDGEYPTCPAARVSDGSPPGGDEIKAHAGALLSAAWSGYVQFSDKPGLFTGVAGSWLVPKVAAGLKGDQQAVDWVGVDGFKIGKIGTDQLIQAGTGSTSIGGKAAYFAWVEKLPEEWAIIPLAVHPQDRVSVYIAEISKNTWNIEVANITTNKEYDCEVPGYSSPGYSAEVVHERPWIRGKGLSELADTGNVTFSEAQYLTGGPGEVQDSYIFGAIIKGAKLYRIYMVNSNHDVIATPSGFAATKGYGLGCFALAYGNKLPPHPPLAEC